MKHKTEIDINRSVLNEIYADELSSRGIKLFIKRDDLIHDEVSGNKWRKLKYNVEMCAKQKHAGILTFGGAYSNHIHAVAEAGDIFGFNTIGLIRGEEHLPLNPTLEFAVSKGMELHYIDRLSFRKRDSEEFNNSIAICFAIQPLIPVSSTLSVILFPFSLY